jgi:hypothetical protein
MCRELIIIILVCIGALAILGMAELRKTENYCVDIGRGYTRPCDCSFGCSDKEAE